MGNALLDRGTMITGRFGHRYMVRSMIQDNGRFQVYEASETGKIFWVILLLKGSGRFKTEVLEPISEGSSNAKEYAWPIDVFNFDYRDRKMFGYIVNAESTGKWGPLDSKKLEFEDRLKVGYGMAKSFQKLNNQGCSYIELPSIWCDEQYNVKLLAVPVACETKFAKTDVLGIEGINAPEQFAVAAVRTANLATDRFLFASLLFMMFIGQKPFVASDDPNYAYARFIFKNDNADIIEKYGHSTWERWNRLGETLQNMFRKTFSDGVINPSIRYEIDDWAYKIKEIE